MNRNKNLNIVLFLLVCLLIVLFVHVVLHTKVYVVYSASLGSVFMIGLVIFLIVFLYLNG